MFGYAKEHEPCIIFMDEIDAIGGRRFSEGTSADREIQRTLMELLNQLDGFDYLGKTKIIMATNRPDTLDPALLRAGRLDRKIEIPLPNEAGRLEVLKIHAEAVVKEGEVDYESVVKMSDGLNGADLRNVVTEAGLFAIKDYRDAVNQDDFNKAVRKVAESKKLEGKLEQVKCNDMSMETSLTLLQVPEAVEAVYWAGSWSVRYELAQRRRVVCLHRYQHGVALAAQSIDCAGVYYTLCIIRAHLLSPFRIIGRPPDCRLRQVPLRNVLSSMEKVCGIDIPRSSSSPHPNCIRYLVDVAPDQPYDCSALRDVVPPHIT